jgi:chromate transporter
MIAVSESTPGPIMINLATYIGSRLAGLQGAIIATICVVLPSFIVIILICIYMNKIMKNKYFNKVIQGLKPCIIGIIIATGLYMCINQSFNSLNNILLLIILLTVKIICKNKISSIHIILISAILGIVIFT